MADLAVGLVQVGAQAMADRYTYIPLIGVFISLVWGISGLVPGGPFARKLLASAAVGLTAVLGVVSWRQVGYRKNGITGFSHAVENVGTYSFPPAAAASITSFSPAATGAAVSESTATVSASTSATTDTSTGVTQICPSP